MTNSRHMLWKKSFILFGLIFLSISALCIDKQNAMLNVLEYDNIEYKIKLQYPKDWQKIEDVPGALVVFRRGKEGSGKYLENLNVAADRLTGQAAKMSLSDSVEQAVKALKQTFSSISFMESYQTSVASIPAYRIAYEIQDPHKGTLDYLQIWCIQNNMVYIFTYTASDKSYSTYLPVIQKVIDSIQILP